MAGNYQVARGQIVQSDLAFDDTLAIARNRFQRDQVVGIRLKKPIRRTNVTWALSDSTRCVDYQRGVIGSVSMLTDQWLEPA